MRKQDILTPIGLVLATALILFGIIQGGKGISIFIDIPSLAIVLGGSFGALLITFTKEEIKLIPRALKVSLTSSNVYKADLVNQFKEISRTARKDGVLALEQQVDNIEHPFLRKGLQLVIDGVDYESIREIMEIEISLKETIYDKYSRIFKIWGSYAPAFGMVGTLIGLIQMLSDLGSPEVIASGMSKALITTFYGAILANALLNPIGYNVQQKGEKEVECMEMMISGIMSIQNGEGSRTIEEKLVTFLTNKEKEEYYTRDEYGESIDVA